MGYPNMTMTIKEGLKTTVANSLVFANGDATQASGGEAVDLETHEIAAKNNVVAVDEEMTVNGLKAAVEMTADSVRVLVEF